MAPGPDSENKENADPWIYQPDEFPKRKHHWRHDYAGFDEKGPVFVGKCPSGMTLDDAHELLNNAVPYFPPRWKRNYPQRLYAVSEGFPEHPTKFPKNRKGTAVKKALLEQAKQQGCEKEVRRWMNW